MKVYNIIFIFVIFLYSITAISAANWQANPYDCPDEYNFVSCTGTELQCGIEDGTAPYCYEPSLLTPLQNVTSNAGDMYNSGFVGGFILNCEETDSDEPYCDSSPPTGDFWCNRNVTCYTTYHRQTRCVANLWSNESGGSECQSCRTDNGGYYACDGSEEDDDGCEERGSESCFTGGNHVYNQCVGSVGNCTNYITGDSDCDDDDSDGNLNTCNAGNGCEIGSGDSCGNSTGSYEASECNGATGNCTATSDHRDCDDDDSDGNEDTCNGANGCEVDPGSSCSIGGLPGTVDDACPYNCAVDPVNYGTSGEEQKWSGSNPFLWFTQLGSGLIANLTGTGGDYWLLDNSGSVEQSGNLTMGNKITMALGNIIEAISTTWLKVTTSLWVDGDLNVTGGITADNITLRTNNICNATACWTLQDLNASGGGSGSSFNQTYANILNQQCPEGQVVNGTLLNGTFTCTPAIGSMDYSNIAMTNQSNVFAEEVNFTKEVGFHDSLIVWFD